MRRVGAPSYRAREPLSLLNFQPISIYPGCSLRPELKRPRGLPLSGYSFHPVGHRARARVRAYTMCMAAINRRGRALLSGVLAPSRRRLAAGEKIVFCPRGTLIITHANEPCESCERERGPCERAYGVLRK